MIPLRAGYGGFLGPEILGLQSCELPHFPKEKGYCVYSHKRPESEVRMGSLGLE